MPLSSSSTGTKALLKEAARLANANRSDPDPEAERLFEDIENAKWGNHSFRRMVDKHVRQYAAKHGVSLETIDLKLGWNQKNMDRDMKMRYDSEDINRRFASAEITREL